MRIRKYHPHKAVLFVTLSTEEGLLFQPNPLTNLVIKSCLSRAQYNHPVKICAFLAEANHLHLILVVDNPDDVCGFVRCFKTESAHMINRIIGRKKRTVWCEGYDSPVVLTYVRALIALAYLYANPAKDNLERSIDTYPGVSSWRMFIDNKLNETWKRIRRPMLRRLDRTDQNLRGYSDEAERLSIKSDSEHTLKLEPNAWMEAFGILNSEEQSKINNKLIERVRKLEDRAETKRLLLGLRLLGHNRIINSQINTTYQSRRSGRRSACLSDVRKLRMSFLMFLKKLYLKANETLKRWRVGDYFSDFPIGLYPPSLPKKAEPLCVWSRFIGT